MEYHSLFTRKRLGHGWFFPQSLSEDSGLVIKRLLEGERLERNMNENSPSAPLLKEPAEKCVEVPQILGARNNIAQPTEKQGEGCGVCGVDGGRKMAHIHKLHTPRIQQSLRNVAFCRTRHSRRGTADWQQAVRVTPFSMCGFHDKLQNTISFLFLLILIELLKQRALLLASLLWLNSFWQGMSRSKSLTAKSLGIFLRGSHQTEWWRTTRGLHY